MGTETSGNQILKYSSGKGKEEKLRDSPVAVQSGKCLWERVPVGSKSIRALGNLSKPTVLPPPAKLLSSSQTHQVDAIS